MRCPVCTAQNSDSVGECGTCHTPLPVPSSENTLDEGSAKSFSVALSPGTAVRASVAEMLEPGTVLAGRYEILQLLGQGGMGAVYKAYDKELERNIALKLIRPSLAQNPEILKRFKQELILARQVTHKNVIRIHDLGQTDDGIKFITMDFVEGRDLRSLSQERGKLEPREAAQIMLQICRALEAAHSAGVIHRDLKPQNIMLDPSSRVYVMDFGIARSAYLPGMTQTGALIGTPEYMSPEQARGEKLTEQSDIFSLGVIFYELLTGKSPYHSDVPLATLWKRMQEKATPPIEVDSSVPQVLSDIVVKALEINPEKRFASAGEMSQSLELWLGPSAHSSTIFLESPRTTAHWKWIIGGTAILIIVAVGSWWLKRPARPQPPHAPVSVLVADFTNYTGDPIFDDTLEPMFNVALEGASFINAYNRGYARREARQVLPNSSGKLDEQAARLVAVREGINAIVMGSLSSRNDGYRLSVEVLDARTGTTLASAAIVAANKNDLLLDVPKLAAPIRKALGDTTPESVQLAATEGSFASSSLEAVHDYGIGMEDQFAGKWQDALQLFSKAAQLDPNFARAYSGMAAASRNLGQRQNAEHDIKLAMEHIDRLTPREGLRLRGTYYILTGDWQKCIEEYSSLVKQYPADNIGYGNLAYCYTNVPEMTKAVEVQRKAVELSPNSPAQHMNLSVYATYAGDFQTGETQAQAALKLNATYEKAYVALAYAQLGRDHPDQAAQTFRQLDQVSKLGGSYATAGLAEVAIYQGRFAAAERMLEEGAVSDLRAHRPDMASDKFARLGDVELLRNEKAKALASIKQALTEGKGSELELLCARLYVAAGEITQARELATALSSSVENKPRVYANLIEGEIALHDKNPSQAIRIFSGANSMADTWLGHFDLGRAYLDAHLFVEAESEFSRCLKQRGQAMELFMSDMPTYGYVVPVYYYLGRAEEGLGSSGAADLYRKFLSLQAKGDGSLLLDDARMRLAKLREKTMQSGNSPASQNRSSKSKSL